MQRSSVRLILRNYYFFFCGEIRKIDSLAIEKLFRMELSKERSFNFISRKLSPLEHALPIRRVYITQRITNFGRDAFPDY